MVAGPNLVHQSMAVLDVQYRCVAKGAEEMVDISTAAAAAAATVVVTPPGSPVFRPASELVSFLVTLGFFFFGVFEN